MHTVSIWLFGLCVIASVVQGWFDHSRQSQRRWYWGLTIAAAIAMFLGRLPDVRASLEGALFALFVMTFIAYAHTPYIKIRGKIYHFPLRDIEPDPEDVVERPIVDREHDPLPDAYGPGISATKLWWTLVGLMFIASVNTIAFLTGKGDWTGLGIGLAFLVFFGLLLGYGDGSWDYTVARGQRLQFGIITVMTAGSFALLYLPAFQTARRWPLRREQSMEYRTHPRHWKQAD
ncbi:hypothetical protein [Mycobacterium sp. SMC-4]|uniref:hypothetical protein n=1 Tax=Mycobacterium sp. SMC-4 TaxID=2857059 RepID=UPI003D014A34